ncbi:PP2C family protein-serine/threonine phosphatase [Nocardioides aurantiacus]|uniref:Serine/threonine protein phosphatase PrpC n=1 Tax=Nocardioides aurantiacus TaxID=86796 RepID=A0A3N2CS35_9ACTN|nr:protein phosphatase 2C domain-containing protein [Nocardioides aurantiacus]ROR90339.1 serine/threonine protein phosphatase PrpC [Nocardioides aurantiacus]
MLRFTGAAASDRGRVRDHNEDSGYAGPGLLVVADGVGGAAAGEVASATAVYVLSALALQGAYADPLAALRSGVRLAQEQVALGVAQDERRAGMATTLTAVLGDGRRFALAHLGDSRAYVWRGSALTRVTRDHTYVQDLVDDGRLTPAEAREHPWRHVVVRSLGGDPAETGDLTWLDVRRGDRVLLCSDGLTDLVDEAAIAAVLAAHRSDDAAVTALVAAANAAGGRDNVTCVLATVVPGVPASPEGVLVGAGRDPRLVVDAAAVHVRRSA